MKTAIVAAIIVTAIVAAFRILCEEVEWPRPRKPKGTR